MWIIETMSDAARTLWYVNNEYRKRLAQVQTCLGLLEQLLVRVEMYYPDPLLGVRYTIAEIAALTDDHRAWRNQYYYDSSNTGRMVQSEREISRALSQFHRLRAQHIQHLQNLRGIFDEVARPDPEVTSSASGDDLWEKAMIALDELTAFQNDVEELRT
jgi:hypothetical protein